MAIDQGASKTHVSIGDERGNILGFGQSYGACHSSMGLDYSMRAVKDAMQKAMEGTSISLNQINRVCAGMTGVDWKFETKLMKDALQELTGVSKITVVNDCIIAMRGGTSKTYGAVLCAGSGLNCAVRNKDGQEFVYGFYIDDEFQGGAGLGKACVRAVLDAELEIAEKTILTELLQKTFQFESVEELLYKKVTNEIRTKHYLQLPPILDQAAVLGDKPSQDILYGFGIQFGRYVTAAMKKMNLLETELEVVLSGSIFKCISPKLRQGVTDQLSREAPYAKLVDAVYEPIIGAFLLGLDEVETETGFAADYELLERECTKYSLKRKGV